LEASNYGDVVFVTLWKLPGEWIGDPAVVALREQHQGELGLVAITFGCLFAIKALS
jgi:hypothetical protein